MAELTLEQQRALALARARVRVQKQQAAEKQKPKKPQETGFLQDLADVGGKLGQAVIDIAKPGQYIAQRAFPTSFLPLVSGTVLSEAEKFLKGARSEAGLQRTQEQQRKVEEEAKAPGALARGLSSARQFLEGPKRPEAARSALSDIADYISPGRVFGSLLPGTPEEAQREVSTVTSQFGSPIEVAEFFASQVPATAATVLAGGVNRATALAQGLGRTAAAQAGERAAVRTGIALNATDAGYSAAQDVLAKGGTQEEADRAFVVAAGGAALASNVASKLPGLEQNLFSSKALKPGIIRGAARSAVGEAPQEFIEESGAQLAQNIGKLGTAAETDISEGLLSSGTLGLIGGATIGAGAGAAQGFAARGAEQPPAAPQPTIEGEPLRTTRITFPNRADPSAPITRTIDVMSEPDADGYITVRDDTGKAFEMRAADLAEREAASAAFEIPSEEEAPPTPTIDRATITERLRLASGTPEGAKPAGRVVSLANDVASALEAEDPVAAQAAIQSRMNALAASRMAETTKAQRQAEIDEAQSIVNDYRVEFARARAAAPARIEAPAVEPSSIEQALEQNVALAAEDEARAAEERAALERESALESASLIGQASPIRQAQTERQQLFNTIINDATVENPAAAFRQALAERNYPNTELNEAERRQVQARLAFEQAPIVEEEPVAGEPTEVPAPPSAAPPEVVAGAAEPVAEEPGVAAVPLGESTEEVKSSEAVSPSSIIGGDEVDIDAFRGQSLFDLLGYISSNEDGRYSPEDVFLAERLNGLLGQLQQAGFDIDLSILQAGDAAPSSIARGMARGLAEIDLKNGKVVVYLRSPQLGNGANSTEIILHESLHAVATGVLLAVKNGRGTPAMMKFRKELNELRNQVIRHFNDRVKSKAELTPFEQSMYNRTTNAFADLDEFLTWGMTNKLAQDYLRSIPIGPTKSLFDKFIDAFRSLLGISPDDTSALSHLIEIVNPIFETTAEDYRTTLRQTPEDFQGQEAASQAIYAGPSIIEPRKEDTEAAAKERRIIAGNYRFAEEMEDQGESPELIRVATGWERNPYDNEWRYLQADNLAEKKLLLEDMLADPDYTRSLNEGIFNLDGSIELQDLIDHPELFQIYPEARNISVFIRKSEPGETTQGSFDPRNKTIEVYTGTRDVLGTILHEVQHWVQDKEGFATGASPESVWDKLSNEQKISEGERAVDYLQSQIRNNDGIIEFIDWALADPDFKRMAKDGLTREDLEELVGRYFFEVPGTEERVLTDLEEILDVQDELAQQAGINPGPINAARLKGVRSQTVANTKSVNTQLDAINDGDVTQDKSPAAIAARDVFQTGTRRSVLRYYDTAGEIEARDVTAQRRKTPEELRKAGALASESKRGPKEVVVSRRGQAPSLSVETQPQASVDPEPVRISRLRQAATRWRTSASWSNIGSQFSGIRAADNWRARSYGLKALPESDSFYSKFEVYLAKKNGQLMKFRRDYVDPIDDAVNDAIKNGVTLDDINDALQARGAAERNAEIAAKNKDMPDGGSGLTDAQAEAILSDLQLSGKMRYINRVLKLHDRLRNKTQEMMVNDGLVSAETMADWKRKYPNYTPYKGWAPSGDLTVEGQPDPHADYGAYEGGRPVYSRVAGLRAKPVKEAKGRSSQAANSLYNMIADAEMFLEMGQRNQVINTVATEYQRDPDAFEGLLTIYDEKNPKIVKGKPVKITDENAYKNGVRAFKNGKPYIIETAPNEEGRATLRAFNNLDPMQLGKWTERLLKLMSVMRGLHTRFNPAFWPREFLRSVSDAAGNVFTEKGRKRSPAYGKSAAMKTWKYSWSPNTMAGVFSHLVNREPSSEEIGFVKALTEEMIVNGGAAGQEFAERAERVAKRMEAELKRLTATGVKSGYYETKEGFNKLLKAVDGINDFVDLVPRVAAYRALTEAGLTPEQAAPIALRSTLDLTKMGRFGRIIDGIFWWTTPSLTNLTRKVTSLDSSTYRKMLVAQLGIGFALGMLNVMNAPDSDGDGEDDYSQMPEWRKLAFLHVYYSPDQKPLTLPIGFLFVFERYVGGKMAEVLAGKTSDAKASVDILTAGQQVGAAFLSSLSPVIRSTEARTLAPTSVAPMYDLLINESFFKSPIYNEPFDESIAQASRAKPSTPDIYKKIAQGLQEMTGGYGRVKGDIDVSPDQLKYFVDQYTGGLGRLAGGAAEGDIEAVKKLNPFYFDPKLIEYSPMGRFYENQPDMKRAIDAQKLADEGDDSEKVFMENTKPVAIDSTVVEAYKTADKELKELRKDANEMDPDEYRSKQLEIMSRFNAAYNDVKRREQ